MTRFSLLGRMSCEDDWIVLKCNLSSTDSAHLKSFYDLTWRYTKTEEQKMNLKDLHETERKNKLLMKAKECIYRYGKLRYCRSNICACTGCVNSIMSEDDYYEALEMPEIQELVQESMKPNAASGLTWVFKD